MKTKKSVVLGVIAFTFAIGSAFASLLTPLAVDAYAETKLTSDPQEEWQCRMIGQCAEAGTIPCEVVVPIHSGTVKVQAKPAEECPTGQILQNSQDDVQGSIEFFDAR